MYTTKGEFIQDLKELKSLKEKREELKAQTDKMHYELYEKLPSPLDYDIIGYEHGETIRALKLRGSYNPGPDLDVREKRISEYEAIFALYSSVVMRVVKTEDMLEKLYDPLKSMVIDVYVKGKTCESVSEKYEKIDGNEVWRYIQNSLDEYF